jgi:hypothetical protein
MKKLIVLGLMVLMASGCFGAFYRSYTVSTTFETEYDAATLMGSAYAKGGFLKNDSTTTSVTVEFSVLGVDYGDNITVKPQETLGFDVFYVYKKVKTLANPAGVNYRLVIGINKIAVEGM